MIAPARSAICSAVPGAQVQAHAGCVPTVDDSATQAASPAISTTTRVHGPGCSGEIGHTRHRRRTRAPRPLFAAYCFGRMTTVDFMDATIYHNPKCSTSRNALAQCVRPVSSRPSSNISTPHVHENNSPSCWPMPDSPEPGRP